MVKKRKIKIRYGHHNEHPVEAEINMFEKGAHFYLCASSGREERSFVN